MHYRGHAVQARPETVREPIETQWRQREAEVRARISAKDIIPPEQLAQRPGLELMRAIIDGTLPAPPIAHSLDFVLVEVEEGHAVFQGAPKFDFYNPIGSVHGGWIATLLDSCVGCAVHSALPAGKGYTTLELKVNYVRALTDRSGPVRAEGRVIHLGGRVATAEGRLVDAAGKLYAHCSTTCLVMELGKK
jgi:uncharacterized protein (TIGR00369 family)